MVGQKQQLTNRPQGRKANGGKVPIRTGKKSHQRYLMRKIGCQEEAQLPQAPVALLVNFLPIRDVARKRSPPAHLRDSFASHSDGRRFLPASKSPTRLAARDLIARANRRLSIAIGNDDGVIGWFAMRRSGQPTTRAISFPARASISQSASERRRAAVTVTARFALVSHSKGWHTRCCHGRFSGGDRGPLRNGHTKRLGAEQ